MTEDDLDFLTDDAGTPAAAEALESVRSELLDWAAAALAARHPHLRATRGTQHVAHARRDLDAHTRHLHNALVRGDPAELTTYLRWAAQQTAHAQVTDDVAILLEAIARFVAPAHVAPCQDVLIAAQAQTVASRSARG
jgi:hypothetical protein